MSTCSVEHGSGADELLAQLLEDAIANRLRRDSAVGEDEFVVRVEEQHVAHAAFDRESFAKGAVPVEVDGGLRLPLFVPYGILDEAASRPPVVRADVGDGEDGDVEFVSRRLALARDSIFEQPVLLRGVLVLVEDERDSAAQRAEIKDLGVERLRRRGGGGRSGGRQGRRGRYGENESHEDENSVSVQANHCGSRYGCRATAVLLGRSVHCSVARETLSVHGASEGLMTGLAHLSRERSSCGIAAACFAVVCLAAAPARATPLMDTYGAWGNAAPFEARVIPGGTDAVFFNPALLVDTPPGSQVGAIVVREHLTIDLNQRPPGADIDESVYDARAVNADGSTRRLSLRPIPTEQLRARRGADDDSNTRGYLTMGMNLHPWKDHVAVGVHVVLPLRTFQTQHAFFPDEREQYFSNSLHYELYGERFETNAISMAAAARLSDHIAIGIGAALANESRAENATFVPDASDQDLVMVNTSIEVRTSFRPYAGIDVRPFGSMHVVSTVHLPFANDTDGTNDLQLWNFEYESGQRSFVQSFDYRSHSSPLRVALGAGWRPDTKRPSPWAAAATVTWTRWSEYRDRHRETPADSWLDTFAVSAGGSMKLQAHRVGVDATYVPSPVPDQLGRSNYVDNDRFGGAMSYSATWEALEASFEAGVQVQVHRLIPRSVSKSSSATSPVVDEFPDSVDARTGDPIEASSGLQTNNPGYPGFSSEGWLLGAGLMLGASF